MVAPLFSKADSNKLRLDVQNDVTLFLAKFGEDLFSISKVIGRKTKWPRFWPNPYSYIAAVGGPAVQLSESIGLVCSFGTRSNSARYRPSNSHTVKLYRVGQIK